jgi:hypothetical protein
MPPSREDTIAAFHRYVNMSAPELDAWLSGPECKTAGTGVGLESGRKISAILKRNPGRRAKKYAEADIAHMRKVVAYCKRHLAQEDKLKESKSPEALEHTKSTIRCVRRSCDPFETVLMAGKLEKLGPCASAVSVGSG